MKQISLLFLPIHYFPTFRAVFQLTLDCQFRLWSYVSFQQLSEAEVQCRKNKVVTVNPKLFEFNPSYN